MKWHRSITLAAYVTHVSGFSTPMYFAKTCSLISRNVHKGEVNDENTAEEKAPSKSYSSLPEFEEVQMSEEELKKEVKKYQLKAQIENILNDPDAPFDLGTELKKVTGGISPPLAVDSPEYEVEEKLHALESSMYKSIEEGDFESAQKKKVKMNQMHIDDVGSVLQVNAAFYKAFSNKDYEAMEQVWLSDASALCIHPSSQPIFGAKNVLASWKEMFLGGNESFQKNKIEPENIRLSVKGTTAILTCDEEVYTKRFVRGRKRLANEKKGKPGMELVNKLTTTNIFRKVRGKWYMIHHHASWHSESDAAKRTLDAQRGNGSKSVEGRLGIPGHVGLGGEKKGDDSKGKKVVKRVFTGSLNDLLSGGLEDILKSAGNANDSDDEEDLGGIQSFIVRGNNLEPADKLEDDDDDGSDLDEEEEDEDDDDDVGDELNDKKVIDVVNLSQLGGLPMNKKTITIGPKAIINPQKNPNQSAKDDHKCSIRQNCIAAIRRFSAEGILSPEQKSILLTDIITKSSSGEFSLVEVAYDLLVTEGDDRIAGEVDFADQCRVFATRLEKDLQ